MQRWVNQPAMKTLLQLFILALVELEDLTANIYILHVSDTDSMLQCRKQDKGFV